MVSKCPRSPFYQSDLYIDPMTMILKLDLDMVEMSCRTKNDVSMLRHLKVKAQTDRQTYIQYENITFPHTRTAIMAVPIYNI